MALGVLRLDLGGVGCSSFKFGCSGVVCIGLRSIGTV